MNVERFMALLLALGLGDLQASGVKVQFAPASSDVGPFPTDVLTPPATNTVTGRRVRMPLPDCTARPSDCTDLNAINELDGFNLQPRIRVTFSGAVDPATLKDGIFFVALDNLAIGETGIHSPGTKIAVNQIVYDNATTTAFAKPDGPMDQHRRYALIVTSAIKDPGGDPVQPDDGFTACINTPADDYCTALVAAVNQVSASPQVVGASVFTTLSATGWPENGHALLESYPPNVRPTGTRSILNIADLRSVLWVRDMGNNNLSSVSLPVVLLTGIGKVAFGSYFSPNFLDSRQMIADTPTADVPQPAGGMKEIFYQAYLPSGPKPATGYPVVIFCHSLGDSRLGGPSIVSPTLASNGFAVISINAPGHAYGPNSVLTMTDNAGTNFDVPAPGRGIPGPDG